MAYFLSIRSNSNSTMFCFEHYVTLGLRYRIFFILSIQRILNNVLIRFLSLHSLETFFWPHTGSVLRDSPRITTARLGPRFTGHITRSRSHFRHRSVSHGCRLEPLPVPSHTDKRTTHSSVLPAPLLSVCAIVLWINSTISRLTL